MEGNAKAAIQFYQKALDAQVLIIQTYGEMPENPELPLPVDAKERVAHAMLKVGETELLLSDRLPGHPHQRGNQVSICITTNNVEKSKQIYEALQQAGQVNMPLQETYMSPSFGTVTDKFGVTFTIFTESPQYHIFSNAAPCGTWQFMTFPVITFI